MEQRRKMEEEMRRKQEEEDRKTAATLQAAHEKQAVEDQIFREQLEQERHDHELALRLAQESNGQIEDSPPTSRRSGYLYIYQCYTFNIIISEYRVLQYQLFS